MWSFRFAAIAVLTLPLYAQTDWPVFGHDPGGLRYSPLKQINVANVSQLQRTWTFHSGSPGSEATPLVVNDVMYLAAPNGIYALEPETGKMIWRFETNGVSLRGVSYWPGDPNTHPRVFVGSGSNMIGIDAITGKPLQLARGGI
jgi:quinoprotein glucose dehydrogenase